MHKYRTLVYRILYTISLVFTRPIYTQSLTTLSLINVIPSLSTNIIDDNNISTSAILELNLNQFTYSSDSDALSNSILSTPGITSS